MAQNDFLQFDENSQNTLTQEEYLSDTQRLNGAASGIARSKLINKALRQATSMCAALGSIINTNGGSAVEDQTTLIAAIKAYIMGAAYHVLSSATASLYGLTTPNNTVDKALEQLRTINVVEITSSGNWTVPDNVKNVDIFLVGGGYSGGTPTGGKGGKGGDGGKISKFLNVPVTPGESRPIVIGEVNGGITSFSNFTTEVGINILGLDGIPSSDAPDNTVFFAFNDINYNICPFNGKTYGIPGAAGGGYNNSLLSGKKGGNNGVKTGGTGLPVSPTTANPFSGGGGASFDNNGSNASSNIVGGKGGDALANTGNGGGGAGGSFPNSGGVAGTGGTGICIIRYIKGGY